MFREFFLKHEEHEDHEEMPYYQQLKHRILLKKQENGA